MDKLVSRFHVSSPFKGLFTPLPLVVACPYSLFHGRLECERASSLDPVLAVCKSSSFLRVAVVNWYCI